MPAPADPAQAAMAKMRIVGEGVSQVYRRSDRCRLITIDSWAYFLFQSRRLGAMRATLLFLLTLLASAHESHARGAAAIGYYESQLRIFTEHGKATQQEAIDAALADCHNFPGISSCQIAETFENTWFVISPTSDGRYVSATAGMRQSARQDVLNRCRGVGIVCTNVTEIYDSTPGPETSDLGWAGLGVALAVIAVIARYAQVALIFNWTAGITVAALFLLVSASLASTTPLSVLKQRAAIAGWIALPAAVGGAFYFWGPKPMPGIGISLLIASILWTDVFAALALGSIIRQHFWGRAAPAVTSLPLAVAACTAVTFVLAWAFINYGTPLRISGCKEDVPFADPCWHLSREGVYVAILLLLLVCVGGILLPAKSNLVLVYEGLQRWIRGSLVASNVRTAPATNERQDVQLGQFRQPPVAQTSYVTAEARDATTVAAGTQPTPSSSSKPAVESSAPVSQIPPSTSRMQTAGAPRRAGSTAGLILGILGGLFGLFVGFFGYAMGGIVSAGGQSVGGIIQLVSMAIPIASLVGGGIAKANAIAGGILMLLSAGGMLLVFGFNFFTAIPLVLSGIGGVLALLSTNVPNPETA